MAMPWRNEAPLGVPGSTKARSLNSDSGATTLIRIVMTAGSAVPNALAVSVGEVGGDAVGELHADAEHHHHQHRGERRGVEPAQRFQNQERVKSETRPGRGERAGGGQDQQRGRAGQVDQEVPDGGQPQEDPEEGQRGGHAGVGDVVDTEAARAGPSRARSAP